MTLTRLTLKSLRDILNEIRERERERESCSILAHRNATDDDGHTVQVSLMKEMLDYLGNVTL